MEDLILGFDIGGTKCAVMTAEVQGENIEFLKKEKCATRFDISPEEMIENLIKSAENILDGEKPEKIGISCGSTPRSARRYSQNCSLPFPQYRCRRLQGLTLRSAMTLTRSLYMRRSLWG